MRSMILDNQTDERVKACVYSTSDNIDFVPLPGGVVFLEPHKSVEWFFPPDAYAPNPEVRFFRPQAIDQLLARWTNTYSTTIRVQLSKDGNDYKINTYS